MTKKILTPVIFIIALFALSFTDASSQTMYFAEGVDEDGYPITSASTFNISRSGGYLYVLTRLPYSLDCKSVKYVIYRNGEYDNTIYQDTERNWTWFWKQVTFYKNGRYTVYLYDCYDDLITSGDVRINFK